MNMNLFISDPVYQYLSIMDNITKLNSNFNFNLNLSLELSLALLSNFSTTHPATQPTVYLLKEI